MNTLDFAAKHIHFHESSDITGPFKIDFYPFLRKPMEASDDISCRRLIVYKASSCMGSVLGEIINTKRVLCDVGNQIMVCQTDEKADQWSKTRGKKWLRAIKDIERLISDDKYAVTNSLWLFRHKWLLISGPGINNAQSDQCRYLQTDESHLEAYGPGCLVEWEKRMGGKWNRQATHITTAPDADKEIDTFFIAGNQNEWHWRCPKCTQLVWPLWGDDSKQHYNGHAVLASHADAMLFVCPHCEHSAPDTARSRYELVRYGDYIAKNPTASPETQSFRWNAWGAAHWMSWQQHHIEYKSSLEAAKLGNLKPLEDFTKKRKCMAWTPIIPDFGDTQRSNFKTGDVWITSEDKRRFASFDFQEGHGATGVHWWGQVDEFLLNGDSRRIDFRRLESWADCRAFQLHHNAESSDTFCDAGHRDKEVFAKCAEWKWYALISDDADEFNHSITVNGQKKLVPNPYFTQTKLQDSMAGKINKQAKKNGVTIRNGAHLPAGWCYSRTWSKPNIGYMLLRLKDGRLGMEYGIPSDLSEEYMSQLNSYMETIQVNKNTGRRHRILKQIRESDHAFATSSQCLLGAIIRGFFPVANSIIHQPTP
jgi:hypothetical protein